MSNLARTIFDADVTAPSVPTVSSVTALSTSSLRIAWSASTDNFNGTGLGGYGLYRSTALAGTYVLIQTLSASSLSYDDTGLSPSTQYFYKVTAFDRASPVNASAQSSANSGTTNSVASGIDFYISPTGSDSNPGTLASPWAITALNTQQGTYATRTVGLLDGTYNVGSLLTPLAFDQYAFTIAGGNSSSSTRILSVNRGGAILNCKVGSSYGGGNSAGPSVIGLLSEYITIDGLKITGHTRRCICVGGASVILNPARRGIRIQNCEFYDNSGVGLGTGLNISQIELNDALGIYVGNNSFHDNVAYAVGSDDHFSCIEVWSSGNGIFEYNSVYNQAAAFQGKAQGNDTYSNIFRYNYINLSVGTSSNVAGIFGFNEGTDFQANTGRAPTEIYNNIIIAKYPILLRNVYLNQGTTTRFFHPVKVYNNTLIVPSGGAVGCVMFVDASAQASFFGNIVTRVSGNADLQGMLQMSTLLNSLIDFNYYFQTSGSVNWITSPAYDGAFRSNFSSQSAFATDMGNNANGTTVDQHGVTVGTNPLFTGTGANADLYKLQGGSPCKNASKSDGTTGGSTVDAGGWGNGAPAVIGFS